jgi:ATP-dependent DNA helicase PIF1
MSEEAPNLLGLNAEQKAAFELIQESHNLFLTGPGGTGKSYFLEKLVDEMPKVRHGIRISVTALTGCAAILLGRHAKTLHSWAGIGLAKGTASKLIADIRTNRRALANWIKTDLLVIDEISMMTVELF